MSRYDLFKVIPVEVIPYIANLIGSGECLTSRQVRVQKKGMRPKVQFSRVPEGIHVAERFTVANAMAFDNIRGITSVDFRMRMHYESFLVKHFVGRIMASDAEWVRPELKEYIIDHIVSIAIYAVNNCFDTEIVMDDEARVFLSAFSKFSQQDVDVMKQILQDFIYDIRGALLDKDETIVLGMYNAICVFFHGIYKAVTTVNSVYSDLMLFQVGPPTSFISEKVKRRIPICLLHPDREGVFKLLPRGFTRGDRVFHKWMRKDMTIKHEDWVEILEDLPDIADVKLAMGRKYHSSVIAELETFLYYGNKSPTGIENKRLVLSLDREELGDEIWHDESQILKQMCTLFLPDWWKHWKRLGWGTSFKLVRRIRYILEVKRWEPDPAKFLGVMFSDIKSN